MKVYPDKVAAHLSKSISPVYIVSGDEPLLVQETTEVIRQQLKKKGYLERDLFHVDGSFDWEEVLFSANSMSLFAEQKVLELRMPNGKPGDKGSKALLAYIENPPEGTTMLLVLPRLDQSAQRSKWFKALDAKGVFVQVWPVEKKDLPRWIGQRMQANGLRADRGAIQVLIDRLEGNLLAASQEIERLKLLSPDGAVDARLVMSSVADNTRFDIFGLIDMAVGQDRRQTLRMLQGLRGEGAEVLFVNSMFAREVRSLLQITEALDAGQPTAAVYKQYRVWDKRKAIVGRCLQARSRKELMACLAGAAEVDARVKGMAVGDPWIPLETAFLSLAGVNSDLS
jgi:DNA polymerase-3 subunit delta